MRKLFEQLRRLRPLIRLVISLGAIFGGQLVRPDQHYVNLREELHHIFDTIGLAA